MKKFYTLFLLMFIFFSLNITCYASYNSTQISFDEAFETFTNSEHSGECKYYIYTERVTDNGSNICELFYFNDLSAVPRSYTSVPDVCIDFIGTFYGFEPPNSFQSYSDRLYLRSDSSVYTNYPFSDDQLKDITFVDFSSKKVADDFFKGPPLQTSIIAEKVEGQEMIKVLQEIVGLLPTILIILVSLVGLRKAWTFLSNVLKAS